MPACSRTFCILRTVEKFPFTTPSFCSTSPGRPRRRRQSWNSDPSCSRDRPGLVRRTADPSRRRERPHDGTRGRAYPSPGILGCDVMGLGPALRSPAPADRRFSRRLRVTGRHVYQSIQTRKRSLNRKGLRAIVIRQPVPARLEALFLKSHAPSFGVIVTFNAQRSDCGFFFILPASSTILRIASARDGRSA
jgi:hypothetical protein